MKKVARGAERRSNPDIFLSHSSKDKDLALRLATDLNFCGVDVWLDEWEIQIGQSLVDVLGNAMEQARFVAILISENYNKSVWTKREYKKALSREAGEGRIVMLPLILGGAEIPDFLEDKTYLDLREQYYSGLARIAGLVHVVSEFRITRALRGSPPKNMKDLWRLLASIGFELFVVFGSDDFDEILSYGGEIIREDYAYFYPNRLLDSAQVSDHVKALIREIFPPDQDIYWTPNALRAHHWLVIDGYLQLSFDTRAAQVNGNTVYLTKLESKLLKYLFEHTGQAVSQDDLIENVWDFKSRNDFRDRSVSLAVARLRSKIEPDQSKPRYIQSVRGSGYRFYKPEEVK